MLCIRSLVYVHVALSLRLLLHCRWMQDFDTMLRFFDETRLRGGQGNDQAAIMRALHAEGMTFYGNLTPSVILDELRDRMACTEAARLDEDLPKPKPNTVRWYLSMKGKFVSAGSKVTVLQAAYCLAWLKLKGNMTCDCLDSICRMMAMGGLLPTQDNIMPRYGSAIVRL